MKKLLLLLILTVALMRVYAQSPTCNIPAIIQAFTNAGYTQFNVGGQPCNLYFYNNNNTTWQAAQNAAQALGGNLATISSQAENDSIVAGMLAAGIPSNTVVWIGFTDAASEGNWVWVDGTPATYTNWNGGEPNNSSGFPGVGENGGQLQLSNGRWNDLMTDNVGVFPAPTGRSIFKVSLCPQITANAPVGCENQPTTANSSALFGSRPYAYAWFQAPNPVPIDNDSILSVTLAAPTVYVAAVQDQYGCADTAQVLINVQPCFTPPGCDIAAIDAAMAAGGYVFMNVQNQPCSRYYYNNTPTANWNTAQGQAAAVGGNLVSINSAAENAALLAAAQTQGFTGGIWIGFTDAASEGNWVWSNGSSNSFTNWNGGEPSNSGGFPCYTDEDGAIMQLSNGFWNDLALNNGCPGATQFRSVIEIDLCPVVTATGPTVAVCENQPAQLTASTTLGSPNYTYSWTNLSTSGNVGTTANVNVTPSATTAYSVQSTDRYGCLAADTVLVTTQTCAVISTCDIPAIDAAMAGAGFVFLNVQNQPCSRYYINPSATSNWNTASNQAAAVGAVLFTVDDAAENAAVLAAAQGAGYTGGVWIGYTDAASEGNWVWQDGTPVGYTNWNPGEPNNTTDICSGSGEDAAIMQLSDGEWNDVYINPGFPCLSPAQYRSIVEVNLCPVVTATANPTTVCAGVSSQLSATTQFGSSPYTYTWTDLTSNTAAGTGSPVSVSPSATTSYQVQSQDRYGCQALDTVTVNAAGGNNQSFTVNPATVCAGSNVTITYTGPSSPSATYTWNFGGGNVVSGSGQGPYDVQYTTAGTITITLDVNDAGCISPQISQTINVSPAPVADAGPDVTVCSGGSVQIGTAAVPGLQYQWFPATNLNDATVAQPVFSATNTGTTPVTTEYVVFTGQIGCAASDTVNVTVNPAAVTTISASGPLSFCDGGSVTLTSDSVFVVYAWSNGATGNSVTVTQTSNIFLAGSDASGCQYVSAPVNVTVFPVAAVTLVSLTDESCFGFADGSITVNATGGSPNYSFVWNTIPQQTGANAVNLGTGSYTVVVTDANNCVDSATYQITSPNPMLLNVDSLSNVSCYGAADGYVSISVNGGTAPLTYTWNNGATSSSLFNLAADNYSLTVTDANNCSVDTTVTISEPAPITVLTPQIDSLKFGGESQLELIVTPSTGFYTYQWSPRNYLSCDDCASPVFAAIRSVVYTVTITDQNGCSVTALIDVNVLADKTVFIPNVFTPDGNGFNDEFGVFAVGLNYYRLMVFNRIGEKVYDSYNTTQGWDGNYKGEPSQPGLYTYYAVLTFLDGENRTYKGTVTLLR